MDADAAPSSLRQNVRDDLKRAAVIYSRHTLLTRASLNANA